MSIEINERKFITDAALGRVAKYMRMIGIDCAYEPDMTANYMLFLARTQQRVILTQSKQLIKTIEAQRTQRERARQQDQQMRERYEQVRLAKQQMREREKLYQQQQRKRDERAAELNDTFVDMYSHRRSKLEKLNELMTDLALEDTSDPQLQMASPQSTASNDNCSSSSRGSTSTAAVIATTTAQSISSTTPKMSPSFSPIFRYITDTQQQQSEHEKQPKQSHRSRYAEELAIIKQSSAKRSASSVLTSETNTNDVLHEGDVFSGADEYGDDSGASDTNESNEESENSSDDDMFAYEYYFVRSRGHKEQIAEVLRQFRLADAVSESRLFTRCLKCNSDVAEIPKESVRDKVFESVFASQDKFFACTKCQQIYWGRDMNSFQWRSALQFAREVSLAANQSGDEETAVEQAQAS